MIYLDSAATTLQKPPEVAMAATRAIRQLASPGRGGHRPAMEAAKVAFSCREEAAALFHVPTPEQVVFTSSATHGLNLAIGTLVRPGARVALSGYEHNAVTRPLHARNAKLLVARAPLFRPEAMVAAFREQLDLGAEVAVCTHVSNVFGYILPMEEIARLCRDRGVPLIVDASQSAGALPLDFQALGADFIAMPGHKGLYGPQGTGLLLCDRTPEPLIQGGTGSESVRQEMPDFLPDRAEPGTHNIPGIAGLREGLRFVRRLGPETIARRESRLLRQLGEGLARLPGVECFYAPEGEHQAGVLSFRLPGRDCEEVGETLADRGFALRAGLHCAPLAHETAGTLDTGTVRASLSAFSREWEVERFLQTVRAMTR